MRLSILGVGLIGGSIGLAARERVGAEVIGVDPDPEALERALARGAIDASAPAPPADADVHIVAAPVQATASALDAALAAAGGAAIVTDVASVKGPLARDDGRYIGGHPLAGAEAAGVEHARADLFADATWYLTPRANTEGVKYERLARLVAGLGARPTAIDALTHDRLMAAVSHLPHVLANVLVGQAAAALGSETMPATGPSFRDATRVAGANPALWGGIYAANADALSVAIDAAIAELQTVKQALSDTASLEGWQGEAAARRRALLETGLVGGAVQELRVPVPNRPGVIAELALALGRGGINIHDMSLAPSPDGRSGTVAFWVPERDAARANELLGAVVGG